MPTVPMDADPEAIMQLTLQYFRERIALKHLTDDDLVFLEQAMKAYGDQRINERGA